MEFVPATPRVGLMIRTVSLLSSLLLMSVGSVAAQVEVLTGRVMDIDGHPVADATVRLEGTGVSTVTNAQGDFQFAAVPAGTAEVPVTAIGYQARVMRHRVGDAGQDGLLISLQSEAIALDEVLVSASRI